MSSAALPWVASSGVEGLTSLRLGLKAMPLFTLRTGLPLEHADDDAEDAPNGSVSLDSTVLELVQSNNEQQLVGLRFNGINLARNADVRSAQLQFTCKAASDEPGELVIQAESIGSSSRFVNSPHNISMRRLTNSKVTWTPPAWKREGDTTEAQRTPDLAGLIQEVIGRDDWQPGNSIAFVISGTGKRIAMVFRNGESTSAKLIVDAEETAPNAEQPVELLPYRVRLHFGTPRSSIREQRVFDVTVQGQTTIENVTLGGDAQLAQVHTLDRVMLGESIEIAFTPKKGRAVLSGIELQRLGD
jgi:hypothetical protein